MVKNKPFIITIIILAIALTTAFGLWLKTYNDFNNFKEMVYSNAKCIDISNGKGEKYINNGDLQTKPFINLMKENGWEFDDQMGAMLIFKKDNNKCAYYFYYEDNCAVYELYKDFFN